LLTAEVSHLIHVARGRPPGFTGEFPVWRSTWRDFLRAFGPGWTYYNQSVEDPVPGVLEPWAMVGDPWVRRFTR
jgi:hypothetical protein